MTNKKTKKPLVGNRVKPYTMQEAFNKVYKNLLKQGEAAKSNTQACKYRLKGKACAAGWLIPDDVYNSSMENQIFSAIVHKFKKLSPLFTDIPTNFVTQLQEAHDHVLADHGIDLWKETMHTIALHNNLTIPK